MSGCEIGVGCSWGGRGRGRGRLMGALVRGSVGI